MGEVIVQYTDYETLSDYKGFLEKELSKMDYDASQAFTEHHINMWNTKRLIVMVITPIAIAIFIYAYTNSSKLIGILLLSALILAYLLILLKFDDIAKVLINIGWISKDILESEIKLNKCASLKDELSTVNEKIESVVK